MNYDDVVLGRRSIRGYRSDPVPQGLVREILGIAMRAPSSVNTQPWNFYVISGEPLDRIREGNVASAAAGSSGVHNAYDGVHRERQVEIAKQLFGAMGIERDDVDGRREWVMRGFRQFDAPVSIVVTFDRSIGGGPGDPGRPGGHGVRGDGLSRRPFPRERRGIPPQVSGRGRSVRRFRGLTAALRVQRDVCSCAGWAPSVSRSRRGRRRPDRRRCTS